MMDMYVKKQNLKYKVHEEGSEVLVTIQEGKFHQVKRMFEAVGKKVVYLKRDRIWSIKIRCRTRRRRI